MGKEKIVMVWNQTKRWAKFNSPQILMGLGLVGMVGTVVLAIKETPKAIEKKKEFTEDTTKWEKVKAIAPIYAPAASTGIISAACIIGANNIQVRRGTALATAYKLSESAFHEYKNKVVEEIGEKKERIIRDKVAEEKHKECTDEVPESSIISTGNGNILFHDVVFDKYFRSSSDAVIQAINNANYIINNDRYICVNDFYEFMGLPPFKMGEVLGFHIDNGLIDRDIITYVKNENGEPEGILDYRVVPGYGFMDEYL